MERNAIRLVVLLTAALLLAAAPSGAARNGTVPLRPVGAAGGGGVVPGRLSDVSGRLAVHAPDEAAPSYLDRNALIRPGDTLWTDDHGRAEIELGHGDRLRLAPATKVEIRSLGPGGDYRIWNGSVYYEGAAGGGSAWIRTPEGDLEADPGCLTRVDLLQADQCRVSCYRASERILPAVGEPIGLPGGRRCLIEGERIASGPAPFDVNALDDFDRYDRSRVDYYVHRPLPPEVHSEILGARDLGSYGSWVSYRGGRYWHPRYESDWRPYSHGYWSYVSGYGYSWVDDQPWGYCTTHYGRWGYYPDCGGWCWAPQEVWAPCYTRWCTYNDYCGWAPLDPWDRPVFLAGGFIGGHHGAFFAGIAFDFGSWSFCPRDDFFYGRPALLAVGAFGIGGGYPYWTGDRLRINNTNIRNVNVVNNVYQGIGVPRAPVRGLAVARDGALARNTVAAVENRIPAARAARIQNRFGVAAARDRALAQRSSLAETALRNPRGRLNPQAVVRGAPAAHAFRAAAVSAAALAAAAHAGRRGPGAVAAGLRGNRAGAPRLAGRPATPAARQQAAAAAARQARQANGRPGQANAAPPRLTPAQAAHERRLAAHQQRLAAHQQRLAARQKNAAGRQARLPGAQTGHAARLAAAARGHQQRAAAHAMHVARAQAGHGRAAGRRMAGAAGRARPAAPRAMARRAAPRRARFAAGRPARSFRPQRQARSMARAPRSFRAPRQARAAPRAFRTARGPGPGVRSRVGGARQVFRSPPRARPGGGGGGGGRPRAGGGARRPRGGGRPRR